MPQFSSSLIVHFCLQGDTWGQMILANFACIELHTKSMKIFMYAFSDYEPLYTHTHAHMCMCMETTKVLMIDTF